MTRQAEQSGFSLVEVLVAMTILAAAFSVLFRILSAANVNTSASAEYRLALAAAESRMTQMSADSSFTFGERTGVDGALHWRESVSEVAGLPLALQSGGNTLRQLEVDVTWGAGDSRRSVSLTTIRYRHDAS